MRIIRPDEFIATPWKNGKGITHELARQSGPRDFAWRLSLADVPSDGPFSAFPGLFRILTVIEGGGLSLHGPDGLTLDAAPFGPCAFDGGVPIIGKLRAGPVRDVNVIYDPEVVHASVQVLTGREGGLALPERVSTQALFVVRGAAIWRGQPIDTRSLALTDATGDAPSVSADGIALHVAFSAPTGA